eukprot:CAMPEP_0117070092 /NCGR_PEP_ID=MMETSP0472-20121206/49258_1 /TAXON_ID=693140 ORGANISM="Tiarina fusus, Strain LIS" /NCGR_SAMPLE_ID=MMETSP0472 /ASSEMBLY_ACC=CAM_ASM_000603 /LENGTH=299 /DNA_ID=CAMNT_0004793087 /DNA_START=253 /DNA_END=1152 /DNA_ORIENTATION=+
MREVAVLLAEDPPKEEKARIKAEALIRDDYMIEAYDILSLSCELLSERIKLISFSKECPPDLVSCVSTLIYASPRVDIPELVQARKQFRAKYGKKFEENALNNVGGVLNERVITKLSVEPPAAFLVQTYLEQICEKYEVSWSPTGKLAATDLGEPMAPPVGYSVQIAQGTGLGEVVATTGQTVVGEEITHDGLESHHAPAAYVPAKNGSQAKDDDFDEPDIFIPAAPNQSHTSSVTSKTSASLPPSVPPVAPSAPPSTSPTNRKDDDDDDGGTADQPSSGGQSSSYRDLAARFENLNNL